MLDAVAYGDSCVQNSPGLFSKPSLTENCLSLNIATPDDYAAKPDHRGVLVWFYRRRIDRRREQRLRSDSSWPQSDTVVVSVNYRVGYLGFFAYPALDGEGHTSATTARWTDSSALKWVQRNIAKFGGDPQARDDLRAIGRRDGRS